MSKHRFFSKEEKVKAVSMILSGLRISEVSEINGIAASTITGWIADEKINPDKEYAIRYKMEHPWMNKMKVKNFKKDEELQEEVPETTTRDPDELRKENKDLRKKIAYLEDKIIYLEALYEVIQTSPDSVPKKKDLKQS
jgi:predicted site-specific integrase-resolvase